MQARQAGAGGGGGDGRDRGAGGRVGGPHQTVPATGLSRAAAHGQSDHHLAAGGRAVLQRGAGAGAVPAPHGGRDSRLALLECTGRGGTGQSLSCVHQEINKI